MVQVRVLGVALDASGQHIILLKPLGEPASEGRVLPIWIGAQEATSILIAIQGEQPPRPLSHDLMKLLLDAVGNFSIGETHVAAPQSPPRREAARASRPLRSAA